jgi:hypothetical protein
MEVDDARNTRNFDGLRRPGKGECKQQPFHAKLSRLGEAYRLCVTKKPLMMRNAKTPFLPLPFG